MSEHLEEIREAALLIRQRAEAATKGPWTPTDRYPFVVFQGGEEGIVSTNLGGQPGADAEHIASWHPLVALAVADWLDGVAHAIGTGDPEDLLGFGEPTAAFAVVRAYLGEADRG